MVTVKNLKEIFMKLISDENFCRLIMYGDNPLDTKLPNIKEMTNYKNKLKERIKFNLQIDDLANKEEVRILIFKDYAKLSSAKDVIRDNTIQIHIYVPNRIAENSFRIYHLEEKISKLLDDFPITSIGSMDYVNGHTMLSTVNGYCLYRMVFLTREGRAIRNGIRR